jgi:hypothetical protein
VVASAALVLGALLVRDLELLGALAGWGFRAGGGAAAAASPALLRPLLAAGGSELLGLGLILTRNFKQKKSVNTIPEELG